MPTLAASFNRHSARAFILALMCVCAGDVARAAKVGTWIRQPSPTFAWLRGVHFLDERRGWVAGTNGTLLRTTDGGAHWRLMPRPTVDALLDVHFADDARGWLLCEPDLFSLKKIDEPRSYVLRTTDGGMTWNRSEPTADEPELRLVRLAFSDALNGWTFGETGALYLTADGGETWRKQPLQSRFLILDGAFLGANQGWLVGANGTVWRTTDAGATWREGSVRGFAAANTTRTKAGAESPVVIGANNRLRAVAFADARRGWTVGAGGQVWATVNGGATWARQRSGTDADLLDVAFANANVGTAVGDEATIINTDDGGRTWSSEQAGVGHRLERVCVLPSGQAWAVGFGGTILRRALQSEGVRPQLKVAH